MVDERNSMEFIDYFTNVKCLFALQAGFLVSAFYVYVNNKYNFVSWDFISYILLTMGLTFLFVAIHFFKPDYITPDEKEIKVTYVDNKVI